MDTETVDTVNKYSKLDLPAKNLLLLEFHGTEAGTKEQAEMVQALAGRTWRRRLRLDEPGRGADQDVAGPPRRGLGGQVGAARLGDVGDRRLRADLAPRRMHPRDAEGHPEERYLRADRGPRRRRQLPSHDDDQSRRPDLSAQGRGAERPHDRRALCRSAAPAPASTASAWARSSSCTRNTARPCR